MPETVTVKDMYDMMKSLNESTKFAMREQTIAAMLETLTDEKELQHLVYNTPEELERKVRAKVPLDA